MTLPRGGISVPSASALFASALASRPPHHHLVTLPDGDVQFSSRVPSVWSLASQGDSRWHRGSPPLVRAVAAPPPSRRLALRVKQNEHSRRVAKARRVRARVHGFAPRSASKPSPRAMALARSCTASGDYAHQMDVAGGQTQQHVPAVCPATRFIASAASAIAASFSARQRRGRSRLGEELSSRPDVRRIFYKDPRALRGFLDVLLGARSA